MRMKVAIYLSPAGCEALAKHGDTTYWHWHLACYAIAKAVDGEWKELPVPKDLQRGAYLGEIEVEVPGQHHAAEVALSNIGELIKKRQAEAEKDITELKARGNELLALSFEGGQQ